MKEFEIIKRYLTLNEGQRKDVLIGIGDDCALTKVPRGQRLAMSMDTLIAGVHFLADANAADIAHKAVATNLSDLAAVGAEPAWITLSLSLPEANQSWLEDFSRGLKRITEFYGVQIVGGDTCQGSLSLTIQAHGFVPENVFHRRSGAQSGELVCVTGNLGDAALGLLVAQDKLQLDERHAAQLEQKYLRPDPRIAAGIALRGRASAAIDISDGLLADLGHIAHQSQLGAVIHWEKIPLSHAARAIEDSQLQMRAALSGGDDYELCFCVDEDQFESTRLALETVGTSCHPIGRLTKKAGIRVTQNKQDVELGELGYQHF